MLNAEDQSLYDAGKALALDELAMATTGNLRHILRVHHRLMQELSDLIQSWNGTKKACDPDDPYADGYAKGICELLNQRGEPTHGD